MIKRTISLAPFLGATPVQAEKKQSSLSEEYLSTEESEVLHRVFELLITGYTWPVTQLYRQLGLTYDVRLALPSGKPVRKQPFVDFAKVLNVPWDTFLRLEEKSKEELLLLTRKVYDEFKWTKINGQR